MSLIGELIPNGTRGNENLVGSEPDGYFYLLARQMKLPECLPSNNQSFI